jgi:hypothetical protein
MTHPEDGHNPQGSSGRWLASLKIVRDDGFKKKLEALRCTASANTICGGSPRERGDSWWTDASVRTDVVAVNCNPGYDLSQATDSLKSLFTAKKQKASPIFKGDLG